MKKTSGWRRVENTGSPTRMRLQRRLYGICSVRSLTFRVPCKPKLQLISFVNYQITQLNAETKDQASNPHIFILLGLLYTLPFWVTLYGIVRSKGWIGLKGAINYLFKKEARSQPQGPVNVIENAYVDVVQSSWKSYLFWVTLFIQKGKGNDFSKTDDLRMNVLIDYLINQALGSFKSVKNSW